MANRRMRVDEVLHQFLTECDSDGDFIFESEEDAFEEILQNFVEVDRFDMLQAASDRKLDCNRESGWGITDSPMTVMPFNEEIGLSVDMTDETSVLDYFYLLFDDDMWHFLTIKLIFMLKEGSKVRDSDHTAVSKIGRIVPLTR